MMFDVIKFSCAGTKADSDLAIVENDSDNKGNNDKEWDKDFNPSSEEDSSNKNGVCISDFISLE